jgi:acetyl-CoA carboxylase biotin carboxyl carrier protein
LEIQDKDFSIKLEKEQAMTFSEIPSFSTASVVAAPAVTTTVVEEVKTEESLNILVKAPLVGTYYGSPSPDSSSFVRVGQKVKKGDTLFIVEAMKVMNEITAPVSGTIEKLCVSDASMVEFGQVVMEIRE